MKRKKLIRFILVLILAVGLAGVTYFFFHYKKQPAAAIRVYGNIDIRQIRLAFHATGRITVLLVEEGDSVSSGVLLAEMDPVRYEAAAARAAADLAAQKQVLARLLAGSRPEEIAEARAKVNAAEAGLENAQSVYQRTQALARNSYSSQQKLDDAEAALKSSRAESAESRQALALALKGPREEDIAAARARLKAYEATLRLAESELADTKLYAPSKGVIQDRILEPGDIASPQTPVYTLALTDPVWVRAYLPESELGKIAPGTEARVTTDSFPGKIYQGWIGFISPTAEFTPKQVETTELRTRLVYRIRVFVCNPQNELRLGMPVTVSIPLNQPRVSEETKNRNPCRED